MVVKVVFSILPSRAARFTFKILDTFDENICGKFGGEIPVATRVDEKVAEGGGW